MKYYLQIIIVLTIGTQICFAQDHIPLKLKKEIIEEINLPIRIGKITCSMPESEIGSVPIPELSKDYPIKFENNIVTDLTEYISFLQAGGQFLDSIGMHISKLKIKEHHNNTNDEVGVLELEVDFYKLNTSEMVSLFHFTETFEISDKNITPFHEYNIRQGISKALNWLGQQKMEHIFKLSKQPKVLTNTYIKADSNLNTFIVNRQQLSSFHDIEQMILKNTDDKKLNRMIGGRHFVEFWSGATGLTGIASAVIGIIKYDNAAENDIDPGNAGNFVLAGLAGITTSIILEAVGKNSYRKRVIKRYNELQLKQNNKLYQPYNPVKLSLSLDLK